MTHENALRMPHPADTARTRIHLVHSSARQVHPPKKSVASARPMLQPALQPVTQWEPRGRIRRSTETMMLAGAALTVPLVWVGHALLHWMNRL